MDIFITFRPEPEHVHVTTRVLDLYHVPLFQIKDGLN